MGCSPHRQKGIRETTIAEMIPESVIFVLQNMLQAGEQFLVIMPTTWKPTRSASPVWLAVTNLRLILFSPSQKGRAFRDSTFDQIDSVAVEQNNQIVKILWRDMKFPDVCFRVPASVAPGTVHQFLMEMKARLGRPSAERVDATDSTAFVFPHAAAAAAVRTPADSHRLPAV